MARVNNDELDELILGEVKLCLQAEGKNLKARMFPWALTSHEKRVKVHVKVHYISTCVIY